MPTYFIVVISAISLLRASLYRATYCMYVIDGKNVMSSKMLEVPLLGIGTVLRLKRYAWSMVK